MPMPRTLAKTLRLAASALLAAPWLAACGAGEPGAPAPCCEADLTLRAVSDRVTFSEGPLLRPSDRGRSDRFSQVRAEFALRGPVDQPEAPLKWAVRGYARSHQALGLLDEESPAFLKFRQASVSVPLVEGDVTAGRIVAGSGTLRTRNLVDYLDDVSVHTETRSGFLPERLENRIGQVGLQVSQIAGSLGAVQWLLVPHVGSVHDSNRRTLSLLRVTPALDLDTAAIEGLWFWSRERTALGLQGSIGIAPGWQAYGELSHERKWPLLQASGAGISVRPVHATLFGAGLEYQPAPAWTLAAEALHNDRPVARRTFDAAERSLASAPLPQALSDSARLRDLKFGFQQPWYLGALLQYQWAAQKLTAAASHYRALRDGSSVSTLQIRLGLGKHAEVSLFARSTRAGFGDELRFTPEARRYGVAANLAF